jgi:hypothetical protein
MERFPGETFKGIGHLKSLKVLNRHLSLPGRIRGNNEPYPKHKEISQCQNFKILRGSAGLFFPLSFIYL